MEKRELGKSGIFVSPITFGGNVFGWTINESRSFELLDIFLDSGFDFIDTADTYSYWANGNVGGESETIIGNWVKSRGNREKVKIATKVGSENREHGKNITKDYILKTVEGSLKRLQTDYIDLYQTHWDVLETPVEETLSAYDKLIKEGKVRAIGASNLSAERLKESLEVSDKGLPRYQTFQPHYNLYAREGFEKELEQLCLDNNLGVINYSSLESGFLTGKYRTEEDLVKSVRGEGMAKYFNERGKRILTALDEVAAKHNSAPAAVSMAWLLKRPSITAPIVSATTKDQLNSILSAASLNLDSQDIEKLNQASVY
ncbi:aldo/keto reductase [Pseudopedobacter saltans DSM 12145]|uniref:Aldo/keto reductase n=1 Tax=Pseudopedobacter saltans (strain ATCC 51119 / DSM 12145 / JCM 21818 / CCUG 39354 / LMG 10337 / NBRC 100064 / NCIMB 13643) TaxID=762903 RepID=F0S8S3_PSESL|nr:aldo/keto reductase [Pseudopedobacter saltans]ADY52404.1 aldo/keto reductase [Pseudopedobacter saltans DSM 12145]